MAPTRTCVGCRRALPADRLVRIVRRADGAVVADRRGTGRGAWLCRESAECLERAVRQHRFERAFRAPVQVVELEQLCAHLGVAWGSGPPDVRG